MKFVIKARPEDFIVEEIADPPLSDEGGYGVYRLTKRGWNTVDLLRFLARRLRLPPRSFSYGGKKDRHSLSRQYISIRGASVPRIHEDTYSLEPSGRMDEPMSPRLIQGNKFIITVRRLSESSRAHALKEMDAVARDGVPNYFDDQRFGSFDTRQGFLGEKVLKKHFSGALKIYLTKIQVSDDTAARERKEFFFRRWGEWKACLERAATASEKEVFTHLCAHPKGFLDILRRIPHEEISVYFSAYQSALWNEMLRRTVRSAAGDSLKRYGGMTGEYLFPAPMSDSARRRLQVCRIPMPGRKAAASDDRIKAVYQEVLGEYGIRQAMFNNLKLRQAYFKSSLRQALVTPACFSHETAPDDLYAGRHKLVLNFTLPRGSYATMFIKRLFAA